ncbi:ATP-grasp fold amidoligase family protein [Pontibacter sp. BT731]|uniref:ATP-grasp fold amidoligase family protein n=1 Tax=Pontibacter coccineus TaxID=3063328 RepID=UPI0026E333CB|nr:ATP-grasp fold amidoligase family protein [Pontibacter sp. BT731]MDO6391452.1 ATP-grasp fold amidoligase family protein [Pontibacter sp. BT731]
MDLGKLNTSLYNIKNILYDNIKAVQGKPIKGHGELSRRIKQRHRTFWGQPDSEIVRNTKMNASDPIEKWKDVTNWQRKLSNKYNAREFAKKHGCRVPDLYWKGRNIEAIDFSKLPEQFVIRPTIGHSSNNVFLMNKNYNQMDNKFYSAEEISKVMEAALNKDARLEFLIEEFVRDEQGNYVIPVNYKIHTFNGEIAGINVLNKVGPRKGTMRAYDENWNMINNIACDLPVAPYQKPPNCIKEIVTHAKILSKAYEIYVRVDFFATDKGAVFNEFTPTPSVGDYFTPEADKKFISYWDKYCKGLI